ncbi:FGGY-family carbohydrate kinase [Sulfidibacter corallicola]|uniref:FGGY-family carbohydrate kinase n=1 Tax=Sulfidibacter corallicola TaxID=2818388 RepID=A0A8A4TIE8_SULCO|nr:FGGY-family carbohydrate kinase [Sulfidibacter corallicola]QTD49267.1 FGGY-family carbohydrate kinase [Sulfidibacter corallicola]
MSDEPQILAIDNGTQSLRALAFDPRGTLIAKVRVPFQPYFAQKPGWAEQDPEVYWNALVEACQTLWKRPGVRKDALAGVAVTTQRGTVVNLDREGRPLRPAILWLDQRTTSGQKPVGGLWGLLFKVARVADTVAYLQANAESIWLQTHQPELWRDTHKFVLLSGFLNYRLTGRFADSVGSQVGYLPFDYKGLAWAGPRDWKWDALGIEPTLLNELVPPAERLGEITDWAAEQTGIPKGLPVIAAAADKACEVLGAGSLEPNVGCLSYGTTATINTTQAKYVESIPFIPPYPAGVPGHYSPEIQIFRGYWMVEWFKQEFGHKEVEQSCAQGVPPEVLLERLIRDIPAGSDGLMLQPYWTPGIKLPGPEAKGGVIGFTESHTRGHLYRAILEGLAYALREGKERVARRSRVPITSLRVSGGGSQSDTALQITADVFGLPTARPHTYETSGLGAAIIASVGLGLHPDFETAVSEMTHLGEVFDPIPEHARRYDALYRNVYLKMYRRLRPLYKEIYQVMAGISG